uniref:CCHC-type domain-containing protein n=1 Tax=Chenopodium quinoa TaxID=63459 RepID=A0A803MGA3_CHEQI
MAISGKGNTDILDLNTDPPNVDWVDGGGDEEDAQIELVVVGRIHTARNINSNALINTLKKLWNPKHGCEANVIGEKLFFFQFHHWRDKQTVMESQPWHFDHHVMILDDAKGNMKPSEIPLNSVPFWVRIYDLPFRGRSNEDNARRIGDKIGTARIMNVPNKCERLPVFCYICGLLGHGEKDCEENGIRRNFSEKLRVNTPWKATKNESLDDAVDLSNAVRKLFITKPTSPIYVNREESFERDENTPLSTQSL